eukprot:Gregarina_sp_Pseudo_9__4857@NODE_507_length_2671_cov_45_206307_g478_i0_p3_GENE_NODE_507_length_2671_cov_45_206307_g478_i0NODE_507_length_2671_cov_45_206307_g478_i0_p3_ORF_typecomplete_len181_score31_48_NODE_507_length_2671_cov_45_206307_g478_i020752617
MRGFPSMWLWSCLGIDGVWSLSGCVDYLPVDRYLPAMDSALVRAGDPATSAAFCRVPAVWQFSKDVMHLLDGLVPAPKLHLWPYNSSRLCLWTQFGDRQFWGEFAHAGGSLCPGALHCVAFEPLGGPAVSTDPKFAALLDKWTRFWTTPWQVTARVPDVLYFYTNATDSYFYLRFVKVGR